MKTVDYVKFAATLVLSAIALSACQAEKSKSTTHFSYEYSYNGCSTGKKSFTDLESYCAALVNNAQNNYCAENLRIAEFNNKCDKSVVKKSASQAAPQDANQDKTSSEERNSTVQPQPETTTPSEVVIVAHANNIMTVKPSQTDGKMISNLSATLSIDSIEPQINKNLLLSMAESIVVGPDLGNCQLEVKNFAHSNDKIDFSLIGVDEASTVDSNGCLARLASLGMTGFSVEFKNVLTSGFNQTLIQRVLLKVEAKK